MLSKAAPPGNAVQQEMSPEDIFQYETISPEPLKLTFRNALSTATRCAPTMPI